MLVQPGRRSRRAFLRRFYVVGTTALVILPVTAASSVRSRDIGLTARAPSASIISGRVFDVLTNRPVHDASVVTLPSGAIATTDRNGGYAVTVPVGAFSIVVTAPGYIGATRLDQVALVGTNSLDLDLIPSHPTSDQQERLYDLLVKQNASPLLTVGELRRALSWSRTGVIPSTIQVYYDRANPPFTVTVPLEDYIKGVVPNEVPASWPSSSLQAQAVAARSYGVASQIANGFVYPDTRSQMFDPTRRVATTDAAVDATAGIVMTYAGSVIPAFFFARCNGITTHNSENATILDPTNQFHCIRAGWSYLPYCRARSCNVHPGYSGDDCGYFGHGVGMCQWGSYFRALNGESYQSIMNDYYTGIGFLTIPVGSPTPTPTPVPVPRPLGPWFARPTDVVSLTWTSVGSGATYTGVFDQYGPNPLPFSTTGLALLVGTLGLGTYSWTIQANGGPIVTSTLDVVTNIYELALPMLGN